MLTQRCLTCEDRHHRLHLGGVAGRASKPSELAGHSQPKGLSFSFERNERQGEGENPSHRSSWRRRGSRRRSCFKAPVRTLFWCQCHGRSYLDMFGLIDLITMFTGNNTAECDHCIYIRYAPLFSRMLFAVGRAWKVAERISGRREAFCSVAPVMQDVCMLLKSKSPGRIEIGCRRGAWFAHRCCTIARG